MRTRYIQDPVTHKLIPADQYQAPQHAGFFVIGDIKPYQSQVTGAMVEGRRQHREHLKAHGVVEVGNSLDKASPKPYQSPKGLKETIARAAYERLRY